MGRLVVNSQTKTGLASAPVLRSFSEEQHRFLEQLVAASAEDSHDSQPCMVVLDIGAGTTDLVVYSGDELTFTRIIPMGGNAITGAIASAVGCSREDAERLKRTTDWIEGTDLESGELADQLVVSAIESVSRNDQRSVAPSISTTSQERSVENLGGRKRSSSLCGTPLSENGYPW